MSKLTYSDWSDMKYFMDKYGDLQNWSSFESRKSTIKKINPRLIELEEDISRMQRDIKDKKDTFLMELDSTPMEED